jgi:hypothetical protein
MEKNSFEWNRPEKYSHGFRDIESGEEIVIPKQVKKGL